MTPGDYFENVILPLSKTFEGDKSLANLYAALTTTYHMVDYISHHIRPSGEVNQKHVSIVREEIIRQCPDFHAIYCVALAQKHVHVKNKKAEPGLKPEHIKKPDILVPIIGGKVINIDGKPLVMNRGFRTEIGGESVSLEWALKRTVSLFEEHLDDLIAVSDQALAQNGL